MSLSTQPPTCTVSKVHICPDEKTLFADWQSKFHEAIINFPGFISLEILSPLGSGSNEWSIVENFADEKQLIIWTNSQLRQRLFDDLNSFLKNSDAVTEVPFEANRQHGGVTEVFVTEVSPSKEKAYRQWISKMHQVEAKFKGFRGVYVQSPSEGSGKNWITLLQFDTAENLDRWLASEERRQVLEESKSMISALDSHRMISPFAGWFSSLSEGARAPAAWKQAMIVLLVLFPIVMLEMNFFAPLVRHLNPSLGMFISNVISVGLVTWPTVPLAIRLLGWWLSPSPQNYKWATVVGTITVILLYAIEVALFWV